MVALLVQFQRISYHYMISGESRPLLCIIPSSSSGDAGLIFGKEGVLSEEESSMKPPLILLFSILGRSSDVYLLCVHDQDTVHKSRACPYSCTRVALCLSGCCRLSLPPSPLSQLSFDPSRRLVDGKLVHTPYGHKMSDEMNKNMWELSFCREKNLFKCIKYSGKIAQTIGEYHDGMLYLSLEEGLYLIESERAITLDNSQSWAVPLIDPIRLKVS